MNFFVKMALKHAAASAARSIRLELQASSLEAGGVSSTASEECVFRRRVPELAQKAVEKIDAGKLQAWAKSAANWLEKESGGGA